MENTSNNATNKISISDDKESLLRFMQDADCLESLSKWTDEFNIFDVHYCPKKNFRGLLID